MARKAHVMSPLHNVIIIGGGPAGYTAAIYASRANLKPILYQGPQPGGQLTTTTQVENYPGYPQGIQGPQLMLDLQQQAQRFGAQIRTGTITAVNLQKKPYQLTIDNKEPLTTHTIIIATGSTPKTLELPNERELYGRGVSTCATCDGYFYRNQTVAVIGGGDSAAEEALYLANLCKEVHLLIRRPVAAAVTLVSGEAEQIKKFDKMKYFDPRPTLYNGIVSARFNQ